MRFSCRVGAIVVVSLICGHAVAQTTERVSISSGEVQGDESSTLQPAISADGRYVAFVSDATNLVPGDTNRRQDIFVRDRLAGTTERVSVSTSGTQVNGYNTGYPAISGNGRFVAFSSDATTLVSNDSNGYTDVFVHDRITGITERVSVDSIERQGSNSSIKPKISYDGRFVAFDSLANLGSDYDFIEQNDVYLRDRQAGTTITVAAVQTGHVYVGSISSDANAVSFCTGEKYGAGDNNGVGDTYVRDFNTGTVQRVSLSSSGAEGNGGSGCGVLSADGRFVAFVSEADNLVPGDNNGLFDVLVRDRLAGTTERVTVDSAVPTGSPSYFWGLSISADGYIVGFEAEASNLVPGDTNDYMDAIVHNRLTGITERVSVDGAGRQGNYGSYWGTALSDDGRFVAFDSYSTNLVPGDTNGTDDIFVRDRGVRPHRRNDALVDLGGAGLWQWMNNRVWLKLDNASPIAVTTGSLDGNVKEEAILSFAGVGLLTRSNNYSWSKLHSSAPSLLATGDLNGNGRDEIAADFDSFGLWVRYDNASWARVHTYSPDAITTADLDSNTKNELVAVFGGFGLWARFNDTNWARLHSWSPSRIVTGDLDGNGKDEVVADFGTAGLWVRKDNGAWAKLRSATSQALAAGDLNGNGKDDVLVSLSGEGLWVRYDNGTWARLHSWAPTRIVAVDVNNSGKDDVVADFGRVGLWVRYDNGTWRQVHSSSAEALVAGGFD
jgi:Tol biopolymer transport system component